MTLFSSPKMGLFEGLCKQRMENTKKCACIQPCIWPMNTRSDKHYFFRLSQYLYILLDRLYLLVIILIYSVISLKLLFRVAPVQLKNISANCSKHWNLFTILRIMDVIRWVLAHVHCIVRMILPFTLVWLLKVVMYYFRWSTCKMCLHKVTIDPRCLLKWIFFSIVGQTVVLAAD